MGNMFVEFTNAVCSFYADQPAGAAEDDALLAWVYQQNVCGSVTRVTDVVYAKRFGTLPTIHKRLQSLVEQKLVEMAVGTDRRTRVLVVAESGLARLQGRNDMLNMALASAERGASREALAPVA